MVDLSSLLSEDAQADQDNGLPAGFLERQGQIESGNGSNEGSIGNIFQVLPSTAANPGYGLSSVDGNDPESVGAYDAALEQQTGSYGGAAEAYNEGIGNYEKDGGASASPAYQQFAANVSAIGGNGNEGNGATTANGGNTSDDIVPGSENGATGGSVFGGLLGGSASSGGITGIPASGAGSPGSGGAEEELGTFISTWVVRILIAIGGLICVAVALSMFKSTAPIVTAATAPLKRAASVAKVAAVAA